MTSTPPPDDGMPPDPFTVIADLPAGLFAPPVPVPLLILDIDGTVRHGLDELGRFVNDPSDVVVFPEAVHLMRAWRAGGGRIIGVSNQGGIALGHVTINNAKAAMVRTQQLTGGLFDAIVICIHHPNAETPELARCYCRKPRPGLAIEAICQLKAKHRTERYPQSMTLMVGDRPEDEGMAQALDVEFEWAADWRASAVIPGG